MSLCEVARDVSGVYINAYFYEVVARAGIHY